MFLFRWIVTLWNIVFGSRKVKFDAPPVLAEAPVDDREARRTARKLHRDHIRRRLEELRRK